MSATWMIYGANGYTGRLAARYAKEHNHRPVLAGRHGERIRPLADELGFASRVFDLANEGVATTNLEGVAAVLHCAGPFSATSRPMLAACLRAGTHYLDITGEIAVLEGIHARQEEIRDAGIVAIPGVGFDVVFVKVPPAYKVETIPFTETLSAIAVTIPWGDVATAYYSTGIPNIEVFAGVSEKQIGNMKIPGFVRWLLGRAPVQAFLKGQIASRVKGPTDEQRARDEVYLYGEAWDGAGHRMALRLRTREGYTLTAEASVKATLRVIEDRPAPGAYTPSTAFGADYVLELEGATLSRVPT